MKFKTAPFLMIFASLLLGSCGFQPMYGSHSKSAEKTEAAQGLAQIDIAIIPDREGQILRNELVDRLHSKGEPQTAKYQLSFYDLLVNVRELDLTKNSEATRSQIIAATTINLTDIETGKIILQRPVKSVSSYNILPSKFATRVTEDNARNTALKDLARQIQLQLTLYFNRDEPPPPQDKDSDEDSNPAN